MSFEAILAVESPRRAEWVDGRFVEMAGITGEHDEIVVFLIRLMSDFLELTHLGVLRHDPFLMRLKTLGPARAPDLLVVRESDRARLRPKHLEGPAALVVEVVSPGSRSTDRADKFYEYEAAGIPEYWLIDPDRRTAEFFVLNGEGRYEATAMPEGVFHSTVLMGFWIRVSWLWERPPLHAVATELGLR
jgi:Uma2 family endonuclease